MKKGIQMGKIIITQYGALEGADRDGYVVFRGIPYAKPPVGALRWKAPRETDRWEGVRKAVRFSAICPQHTPGPDDPFGNYYKEFYAYPEYQREQSEDCLYLNIWTPDTDAGNLPVAFYIHGGGFSGGYSSEIEFDGEEYCKKGVVLVTVGYRVGAFGFLAHPWLSAENERGISGNYGLLDQIAALRWTVSNIAAFGGDPDNITVFGQSAGSMSTQALVSSPLTKNWIAKAILQSGVSCTANILAAPTLKNEEEYGLIFASLAGVSTPEELRNLTADEILNTAERFGAEMFRRGDGLVLVPNTDGYVLEKTVRDVWKEGSMKKIPYIAGCVGNDLGTTPEDLQNNDPGEILRECRRWAEKASQAAGSDAYVYHFARKLPGDNWGAFHSSELWYMLGTLHRCWRPMTEADYELSAKMVNYWTCFMKTGAPDPQGNSWKPCAGQNGFVKVLDV